MSNYRSRTRPPERLRFTAANDAADNGGDSVLSRSGQHLRVRQIRADDVLALQRGFARLTPDEIRMRFLHTLTELPDQLATRLCNLDPQWEIAWVLADPPEQAEPEIHGVARAYIDASTDSAEFALIVQKYLTGQGFGTLLFRHIIESCRARGVREIWGDVVADNQAMLRLCDSLGFSNETVFHDSSLTRVRLAL